VALTWRRLDRLASAATLGMILASPRAALLVDRTLGPRIPSSAAVRSSPCTEMRRREARR
jgi:hypothetical protein